MTVAATFAGDQVEVTFTAATDRYDYGSGTMTET